MFDDWRVGFIRRPLSHVLDETGLGEDSIVWLPPRPRSFQFIADPFGVERDGLTTVFFEHFGYRVRRGEIHYAQYDGDRLVREGEALIEPFHLSYPGLIENDGELYMLPCCSSSARRVMGRSSCSSHQLRALPGLALARQA